MSMTLDRAYKIIEEQKNAFLDEYVDYGSVAEAYDIALKAIKDKDKTQQILTDIYQFAYKTFFGADREEVLFRISQGSNGTERKVLEYIKNKIENI